MSGIEDGLQRKLELIREKSHRERLEKKEKPSNSFLIFHYITSSVFIGLHQKLILLATTFQLTNRLANQLRRVIKLLSMWALMRTSLQERHTNAEGQQGKIRPDYAPAVED